MKVEQVVINDDERAGLACAIYLSGPRMCITLMPLAEAYDLEVRFRELGSHLRQDCLSRGGRGCWPKVEKLEVTQAVASVMPSPSFCMA